MDYKLSGNIHFKVYLGDGDGQMSRITNDTTKDYIFEYNPNITYVEEDLFYMSLASGFPINHVESELKYLNGGFRGFIG